MKIINFTVLLLLVYSVGIGQTPELVADFYEGEESSFNEYNYKGIKFGDKLIFPIVSGDYGEELGVLNNGQLSILKDINIGAESSDPTNFIAYKDKIYFSAFDSVNGGSLWVTDGTEENTQVFFTLGSATSSPPNGLIVSDSGWLYYTYGNVLYRTDGSINESIYEGVGFSTTFEQQSTNYTKYKDEIAFVLRHNDAVQLYTIEGDAVVQLASVDGVSNFVSMYGLSEVEQGLVFAIQTSGPTKGTYYYDFENDTIEKITIANGSAKRLHPFNRKSSLAWVSGSGYYTINGEMDGEELLYSSDNSSMFQGETVLHGVFEDKMIFHGVEGGFFGDNFIIYTDGTNSGTTQLFEVDEYLSNILIHGNYAFVASGTSNGYDPEMYYVDMNDGTFTNFYNYNQPSLNTESILFMGVIGNKLYYLSNLDLSIGRELYSIDVDIEINTSIEDIRGNDYDVKFANDTYKVVSDDFMKIKLEIFTIDGRLITSKFINTNSDYKLPDCNGICVMRFQHEEQIAIHKYFGSGYK